ncbi:MAG TPA: ABC transporter permease [Gemmatimonadaceae bacterium]|nr:ABC transporter permease [Gemmatimonadaceae bacterium]
MPFLEAVRLALATIRVQKLKSFFTVLGVMIGVMFLIAVISIVEGMGKYMEEDFAGKLIGVNTFTVRRTPNFGAGDVTEEMWRAWQRRPRVYPADVATLRAALPPGSRTAIESETFAYASTPWNRPRQVQAVATDGEYFQIKQFDLLSGRVFSTQEARLGLPVVVIGTEVAEHFFPNLEPLGRELRIRGIPYRVIGVLEKQGSVFGFSLDRLAIAPFNSPLSRVTNPRGDVDGLIVQGASDVAMQEAMEVAREVLRGQRKLSPAEPDNFVLETSDSALSFFAGLKSKLTVFGAALPAIGLIVGALVIMNIMLVAVAERTREIGVRKSLGARRKDIMMQFLVEAATLSVFGAGIGIGLGLAIARVTEALTPLPAAVAPWSIVFGLLMGAGVGIAAGAYPASRASRLDPITALRQE